MKIETKATLKYLRMAPRKVRLLVDLVRGMKASEALVQLQYSGKQAALPVFKLIRSAMANAQHNHGMAEETLKIKTITVNGGPVLHRFAPHAFGRASKIRKRTSHITLVLEGEATEKKVEEKEMEETKAPVVKKTTRKTTSKKNSSKKTENKN